MLIFQIVSSILGIRKVWWMRMMLILWRSDRNQIPISFFGQKNMGSPIHIGCGLSVILGGRVFELHLSPSSWWIWGYYWQVCGWVWFSGINPKIMKRFFRYYIIIFVAYGAYQLHILGFYTDLVNFPLYIISIIFWCFSSNLLY